FQSPCNFVCNVSKFTGELSVSRSQDTKRSEATTTKAVRDICNLQGADWQRAAPATIGPKRRHLVPLAPPRTTRVSASDPGASVGRRRSRGGHVDRERERPGPVAPSRGRSDPGRLALRALTGRALPH